jgi:hypothetical protein
MKASALLPPRPISTEWCGLGNMPPNLQTAINSAYMKEKHIPPFNPFIVETEAGKEFLKDNTLDETLNPHISPQTLNQMKRRLGFSDAVEEESVMKVNKEDKPAKLEIAALAEEICRQQCVAEAARKAEEAINVARELNLQLRADFEKAEAEKAAEKERVQQEAAAAAKLLANRLKSKKRRQRESQKKQELREESEAAELILREVIGMILTEVAEIEIYEAETNAIKEEMEKAMAMTKAIMEERKRVEAEAIARAIAIVEERERAEAEAIARAIALVEEKERAEAMAVARAAEERERCESEAIARAEAMANAEAEEVRFQKEEKLAREVSMRRIQEQRRVVEVERAARLDEMNREMRRVEEEMKEKEKLLDAEMMRMEEESALEAKRRAISRDALEEMMRLGFDLFATSDKNIPLITTPTDKVKLSEMMQVLNTLTLSEKKAHYELRKYLLDKADDRDGEWTKGIEEYDSRCQLCTEPFDGKLKMPMSARCIPDTAHECIMCMICMFSYSANPNRGNCLCGQPFHPETWKVKKEWVEERFKMMP